MDGSVVTSVHGSPQCSPLLKRPCIISQWLNTAIRALPKFIMPWSEMSLWAKCGAPLEVYAYMWSMYEYSSPPMAWLPPKYAPLTLKITKICSWWWAQLQIQMDEINPENDERMDEILTPSTIHVISQKCPFFDGCSCVSIACCWQLFYAPINPSPFWFHPLPDWNGWVTSPCNQLTMERQSFFICLAHWSSQVDMYLTLTFWYWCMFSPLTMARIIWNFSEKILMLWSTQHFPPILFLYCQQYYAESLHVLDTRWFFMSSCFARIPPDLCLSWFSVHQCIRPFAHVLSLEGPSVVLTLPSACLNLNLE